MKRVLVALGPAVVWAAVLFYLSSQSFVQGRPLVQLNDKVVHMALYTVLGAALAWAGRILRGGERRRGGVGSHAIFIALGLLYGVSDEIHQMWVPNRTPSVMDWLADAVGVLVGYGMVTAWQHWRTQSTGGAAREGWTG